VRDETPPGNVVNVASVGAGLGTSTSAQTGARAQPAPEPGGDGDGDGSEAETERGSLSSAAQGLLNLAPVTFVSRLFERRAFEEGTFDVEGLRLHYERHGEGSRVLVFLHGLLLDNQLSRRLAADLADRGFQVVLLDLPGHGRSDKPRHASVHRMDSYARHVVALLDELGIDQAVIGGVSLGANVSLQVAVQAPERVRGLLIEMPVLEWAVPGAAVVFLPMLLGVHYAAPLVRIVASLARRLPRTTVAPLDSVVSMLTAEPEELVGPITPTYEARHAIRAPALVIGHKIDFIHPFTDADHLTRQLQHARLIEARSIFELRLAPDRLTAEIAEFLDATWDDSSEPEALDQSA
jgi:pimeloyl-ACP methyl ester carboxylesterase